LETGQDLDLYFYLAKNQNQTETLKIKIRLTAITKPGNLDSLISMSRPTPAAAPVSTIPAARAINQAGKYQPKTSIEDTCFWGELQLSKNGSRISSVRLTNGRNFER
jgi:hypothetical protein